ncbi:MAG: bifunctional methylenetetrahydrofolate dehydrogenase/methenyltetrahydrofolate cyclohydrolase FolD [Planctomycetaceae bacterium]|nr:bifunctional methylenetetrahydrofolate dehydrogenase/methenyltetrahydrofolate cyclohydrolase FolD [Planctomycetaceae bacterium]
MTSATLIDGKRISAELKSQIATEVSEFVAAGGVAPHLVVILVGEDPASQVYVRNKQKACEAVGMKSTLIRLSAETTQAELLDHIARLKADAGVQGILVQLPLPRQIDEQAVLDAIPPHKDVDAFHPENVGLLVQGRPRFLPCTPAGCMQLIASVEPNLAGKHAVVIGRSEIVGKPMGLLLIQKGVDATVTICHSRTRNLTEITRQADVLIAAIGRPNFVTGNQIKPGAIVIDVGINRTEDGLCGDVEFASASQVASAITPVPGGVGPMTIANLLKNTLTAARLQQG